MRRATLNPPQARPVRDLTGIEVRRGSRTGRGALIGAGAGVLGGLAYLVGSAYGDRPAQSTGEQVATVAVLAGVWSALGALIGSASDDWETVR